MDALPKGDFKEYLGNPFTSWFFVVGLMVASAPGLKACNHYPVLFNEFLSIEALAFSFIIISGFEQNYFLVSPEYVIAKNSIFIWQTKVIDMKEITGVSIERAYHKRTVIMVTGRGERTFRVGIWNFGLDELVAAINGYIEKPNK